MGIKLLLADDSITIQKVVGIIFASEDYDLTIVDNGSAALVKATAVKPDVLLVDAVMPGMTGYEVCEEVRRDQALANVPILLLTGAFEPFDEDKARKCGADDFISKPFESQSLIDKVSNLVSLGRERTAAAAPVAPQAPPPIPAAPVMAAPPHLSFAAEPPQAPPMAASPTPVVPPPSPVGIAEASGQEEAGDDFGMFAVEMVEGSPEDDLWGAFELEDVAEEEEEESLDEQFAVEEEPFIAEVVEDDPFSFAEELEPVVEPAPVATIESAAEEIFVLEEGGAFEVVSEDPFGDVFAEEAPAPAFETVAPKERFAVEEGGAMFDIVPEDRFGGVFEEEAVVQGFETISEAAGDQFDVLTEEPVAAFGEEPFEPADFFAEVEMPAPSSTAFEPDFELAFAPEEEYIALEEPQQPVPPPVAAVPPPPAAAAEFVLNEEQLASLVARISRDILEKIAWEVVPDLAERIIREEIRKLKEGQ